MGRVNIEVIRGYRLVLFRLQPEWLQMSFAEIVSEWSGLSNPIRTMQYERLISDIVELECPVGIMLTVQGVSHRDNGGGTIVYVEDEKAHIIFERFWNEKWSWVVLETITRIVGAFEEIVGVSVYDPQLGRTINIHTDLADIETAWKSWKE